MNKESEKDIFIKNQNLIWFSIKKLGIIITDSNKEDLFQIGSIGLVKAIRTYNEDDSMFSTYATKCIINEIIINFIGRNKQKQLFNSNMVSINSIVYNNDYTGEAELEELIGDKSLSQSNELLDLFGVSTVDKFFNMIKENKVLKDREVDIMKLFLEGYKQRDIAREYNLTQATICRIYKKAINKIKKYYDI